MRFTSLRWSSLLVASLLANSSWLVSEQTAPRDLPKLTREEKEEFLRNANILKRWDLPMGVTNSQRATLSDGRRTHDAHIQTVDIRKLRFNQELMFHDSYKFNIAAYRLDKIMDLNMIPVSVERKVGGTKAAVTWWIDDFLMYEVDRVKKKVQPVGALKWVRRMANLRVFDELICNTDRNQGNIVFTSDWKVWMIDHTRAFRRTKDLRHPKVVHLIPGESLCGRKLLYALRKLKEAILAPELLPFLIKEELQALLARRDRIVKLFDKAIEEKGEHRILFDLPKN